LKPVNQSPKTVRANISMGKRYPARTGLEIAATGKQNRYALLN
jgi:hypothetical protein